MNRILHGVARAVAETFELPEPIVEVGSYQVAGQENIADLRSLFPGREYLGIDARPGPGVEIVANVEDLPFPDSSVGTVIAMSTFEHVAHFWRGFEEVRRVLRPDGAFFVACPFYFYIHNFPSDYWRFTPEALKLLLDGYPSKLVGWHGPAKRPANVWALALREEAAPIGGAQFDEYRARLAMYARQPLSWSRKLRYTLAQVFCGRGPFAPYLEQEKWETECQTEVSRRIRSSTPTMAPPRPTLQLY